MPLHSTVSAPALRQARLQLLEGRQPTTSVTPGMSRPPTCATCRPATVTCLTIRSR